MKQVEIFPVDPTYVKDNGLKVFSIDAADTLVPFAIAERSIVHLPPGQIGGNHSHPRAEAFIALGDGLELHWIDSNNVKQVVPMNPNSELRLLVIPPHVPHAVINTSDHSPANLIEYADAVQLPEQVTAVQVIHS